MHLYGSQTRGEGAPPAGKQGKPRVPEKEVAINPINLCGELAIPEQKLDVSHLLLIRLTARLVGSTAIGVLQGVVIFSDLFSDIFMRALFERANKIMLM